MLQKTTSTSSTNQPSKEQKRFQQLTEKLKHLKALVEEKKRLASKLDQLKSEFVSPLFHQLKEIKVAQVRSLDWSYGKGYLNKRLKYTLREEILDRADVLLTSFQLTEAQHSEVTTIYARHSGENLENLQEDLQLSKDEATREYLQEHYGITFEENESVDLQDPEVIERIREKINERTTASRKGIGYSGDDETLSEKARAIQDKLSKSIRSVYTALVKHLHPDKEQDEEKKIHKTELIKEVTLAYENKDMLTLLTLQASYGIANDAVSDSDLRSYNTILQKQVSELENEHQSIVATTRGIPLHNEHTLSLFFKTEKNNLKKIIKQEQSILQGVFENEDVLEDYLRQRY